MSKGYVQIYDGEWFRPVSRGFQEQCCDCGLVHVVDFRKTKDGKIEFRARVDKRKTAAVRRHFKFEKADE